MATEALHERLPEVVRDLRLGREGAAGEGLAALLVELHGWLQHSGPDLAQLLPVLTRLLEAQERADALALADRLEFELLPRLGGPGRSHG